VIQFNRAHKVQYLDESSQPLYGFGYGLTYTTFEYADLTVESPEITADGVLRVSVTLTNTGERAGDEVAQLYVQDLVGEVTRPVRELKGFRKVSLQPGESRRVTIDVPAQELGFHGLAMSYIVEPGEFNLWVGPNAYEGLEGQFVVKRP
jgi:beta-glucosidase